MEFTIFGHDLQVVDIRLKSGETVYSESGGMAWMSDNISMNTEMKGGLMGGLKRKLMGESLMLTDYTCQGAEGPVAFASEFPGKIVAMTLAPGQIMVCQKDSFMCAEAGVLLEMHFNKRLGAGLFGGEGFILQKVTGPGQVFFELAGHIVEYDLVAGQRLKVDPGYLALMEPTVQFDIEMVKGVKNILFGGEGLFLANVTGPGKVWLQSMPLPNFASRLIPYLPSKG